MKTEKMSSSCVVLRFIMLFILLASLLVLPNSGCNKKMQDTENIADKKDASKIGSTSTIGQLEYMVRTEDSASQTGTVSAEAISEDLSGIAIPSSVVNGEINYSVTVIPAYAFAYCTNLTNIIMPDSITEIKVGAFYQCTSLTSIDIPDSVTEIGEMAFCDCSSLASISIPDSVTKIGKMAFCNCSSLANIAIPDSVTEIGKIAFCDCSSLTSIIIPNSVAVVGDRAFAFCGSLTNATIGNSVTFIGNWAFAKCNSLADVYFRGNAPKLPRKNAFYAPSVIHYKPGTT